MWERGPAADQGLWLGQMALNFAWSPVLFGLHRPGLALVIMAALPIAILDAPFAAAPGSAAWRPR